MKNNQLSPFPDKEIGLAISSYKSLGYRIIDSHVHPLDVMGVLHHSEQAKNSSLISAPIAKPSLIEKLKYGKIVNLLAGLYCEAFPNLVDQEIKDKYIKSNLGSLIAEMDASMIDESVLVPIEPIIKTEYFAKYYSHKRLLFLGSIDPHTTDIKQINERIDQQINQYKIVGIKLHPNLQNFSPVPENNKKNICEKLDLIYRACESRKLYILIHAGKSFYTRTLDKRYGTIERSKTKGRIRNFFYRDGASIFERYNIPFVIAHMAHYGENTVDDNSIAKIAKRENVFFDSSGTSPRLISQIINKVGIGRIIFGSDAIYNRQAINVNFMCQAIKMVYNNHLPNKVLESVFYSNFFTNLVQRK